MSETLIKTRDRILYLSKAFSLSRSLAESTFFFLNFDEDLIPALPFLLLPDQCNLG